jgi:hypothetical protein
MAGNSHGHTLAAWTGVTIAFIGFLISGVCTVIIQPVGFVAGLVVVAIGGIVGWAMRAAGYGQPPAKGLLMSSDSGPKAATAGAGGGSEGNGGNSAGDSSEQSQSQSQPQGQTP